MRCCYLFDSGASAVKILAVVGQTVILPCRKQVREENVLHVEWKKDSDTAFVYKDGCEAFGDKSDAFLYRTQLILKELKDGNMSLRLSDVRLSDAGTWTCRRNQTQVDCTVELSVGTSADFIHPNKPPNSCLLSLWRGKKTEMNE